MNQLIFIQIDCSFFFFLFVAWAPKLQPMQPMLKSTTVLVSDEHNQYITMFFGSDRTSECYLPVINMSSKHFIKLLLDLLFIHTMNILYCMCAHFSFLKFKINNMYSVTTSDLM